MAGAAAPAQFKSMSLVLHQILPEPSSLALLGVALLVLIVAWRVRRAGQL